MKQKYVICSTINMVKLCTKHEFSYPPPLLQLLPEGQQQKLSCNLQLKRPKRKCAAGLTHSGWHCQHCYTHSSKVLKRRRPALYMRSEKE